MDFSASRDVCTLWIGMGAVASMWLRASGWVIYLCCDAFWFIVIGVFQGRVLLSQG